MVRVARVLGAALLLTFAGLAGAADTPTLAGSWKIFIEQGEDNDPWWLLKLEEKDGKWIGTVTPGKKVPTAKIEDVAVDKDGLRFTLVTDRQTLAMKIKTPANATDKLLGLAHSSAENFVPVRLERTMLTSLDPYELDKEYIQRTTGESRIIKVALGLMDQAAEKKAKPEDVRSWADKASKTAEQFGTPYQRLVVQAIAQILTEQEGYAKIAVSYARQAERMLDAKEKRSNYNSVLETLAVALEKDGKAEEAKEVRTRLKKTDLDKPDVYAGRKNKSDRAVLVELFTGAHHGQCVAPEKAIEALSRAYKPNEVIVLQYHEHVIQPDPLANSDGLSRMRFYQIKAPPAVVINGARGPAVGGAAEVAAKQYDELVETIDPLLEKPAGAKINLTAAQKDKKIEITAEVSDASKTGDDIHLRFVLVEEAVSYTGANKVAVHHNVVRAFPGGTTGAVVQDKTLKKTITVDLDEVRKSANEHLDKVAETNPFPDKERPIELKKLRIVAFIQDDDGGDILHAAQVDVK
jgi:hypothetical protein